MTERRTRRWRGVIAVALTASALGLFGERPALLLVGITGAVYAMYPHLTSAPTPAFELERDLDPRRPADGEAVEVTVTLTNESDDFQPDVRVVDGVPPMIAVTDDSPRHAAAIPAGESISYSYTVEAAEGIHAFEPATVIARDVSGAREVETTVAADTTLAVSSSVADAPLRTHTLQRVGQLVTDKGGSGVEFHRVREYHESDPLNRVDWRRYAKSRELSTIDYRTEQAASVVICLDTRPCAFRARREGDQHAVSHGLAATEQLVSTLSSTTNTVGVAAVGRDMAWIPPGTGGGHATRVRRTMATNPAFSAYPPSDGPSGDTDEVTDGDTGDDEADTETVPDVDDADRLDAQINVLRRHLGADTQVIFVTPLPDHAAVEAAFTLEGEGHAVTVLSPDVSTDETLGNRVATLARRTHMRTLREAGIPVVDWDTDQTLGQTMLARSEVPA